MSEASRIRGRRRGTWRVVLVTLTRVVATSSKSHHGQCKGEQVDQTMMKLYCSIDARVVITVSLPLPLLLLLLLVVVLSAQEAFLLVTSPQLCQSLRYLQHFFRSA